MHTKQRFFLADEAEVDSKNDNPFSVEAKYRIPFRSPPSHLFFIYLSIYLCLMNQSKILKGKMSERKLDDVLSDLAYMERQIEAIRAEVLKGTFSKFGMIDLGYMSEKREFINDALEAVFRRSNIINQALEIERSEQEADYCELCDGVISGPVNSKEHLEKHGIVMGEDE